VETFDNALFILVSFLCVPSYCTLSMKMDTLHKRDNYEKKNTHMLINERVVYAWASLIKPTSPY
jgi:hypothetical protein